MIFGDYQHIKERSMKNNIQKQNKLTIIRKIDLA